MINVMIVEDDANDLDYCCHLIERMGLDTNIVRAVNGTQALELLDGGEVEINAALLDVRLPDMDGFALAAAIRNMSGYKLLKIVFVTGEAANQLDVFKTYRCYDYITKPVAAENFHETLAPLFEALLEQKQSGRKTVAMRKKGVYIENSFGKRVILLEEIFFAEITGRELLLHTKQGQHPGIKMKLKDLVRLVGDPSFVRCHKSFAVNLSNAISLYSITKRTWAIDFGPDHPICPVSYTYYHDITEQFRKKAGEDG